MMKLRFLLAIALVAEVHPQVQWTTPVQITHGTGDDTGQTLINSHFSIFFSFPPRSEWVAFTRTSAGGSTICLLRSDSLAGAWSDSTYTVSDSGWNCSPSLARYYRPSIGERMMLVWSAGSAASAIYYSSNWGEGWSSPMPVSLEGTVNASPQVVAYDSGFGVVWSRDGTIAFSEFSDTGWSPVSYVTSKSDSGNSSPQVRYVGDYSERGHPLVVWERSKISDSSHAIAYSILTDSGWTSPDTIAWTGDNRNPRFYSVDLAFSFSVSYESNRTGQSQIYTASGDFGGGTIYWYSRDSRFTYTASDERNASFTASPIITVRPRDQMSWWTAGTWRTVSGNSDSISAMSVYYFQYLSAGASAVDRNPAISSGVFAFEGIRVWTVWESDASGSWKLYGSRTDVPLEVKEKPQQPAGHSLLQNFPNPFNPNTAIHYEISAATHVTLRVFDLLGRELIKLVNEDKQPGRYDVSWDGRDQAGVRLASGVYLYRIQAGEFVEARKMMLLK